MQSCRCLQLDKGVWQSCRWYPIRQSNRGRGDRWNAQLYLFKKNFCWIWVAVDRYGKRFIDCALGDRGTETGKQLWDAIQDIRIEKIATDYWKPYENFVPKDMHIQSKAETFTVEGYNSLFRHFLARLRRKSKCYSKSKEMLKYSITLLMLKWNYGLQAIIN